MFKPLNSLTLVGLAIAAAAGFASAAAASPVLVTNPGDRGAGSLRAALEAAASAEAPVEIVVVTEDDISIGSGLDYAGKMPLSIYGNGQTVKSDSDVTLLTLSQGADLTVDSLNFAGPGGYSIEKRGKAGKGIFIDMRDDQTGKVTLSLRDVKVSGVAYHGVHVADCNLADDCGSGRGGKGEGSAASIEIWLSNVEIDDVGNGRFDADGLRVDERGEGDIRFFARDSSFTHVGADGVELDEGQEGSVLAKAIGSDFSDNGAYCDPELLKPFMPKEDEAEFDDGEKAEADIPGKVTGSPDDACFEREVEFYDSGSVKAYEIGLDTDDGFDIDEAGPGDLKALLIDAEVDGNYDEGLDFGEEDEGSIDVAVIDSTAADNTDDGIKVVESEPGDVAGLLHGVSSTGNGGKGAVFEQRDAGDLEVLVVDTETADNDDSDKTGLEVVQDGDGAGTLTVRGSDIADGIDAEGVEVTEEK